MYYIITRCDCYMFRLTFLNLKKKCVVAYKYSVKNVCTSSKIA